MEHQRGVTDGGFDNLAAAVPITRLEPAGREQSAPAKWRNHGQQILTHGALFSPK